VTLFIPASGGDQIPLQRHRHHRRSNRKSQRFRGFERIQKSEPKLGLFQGVSTKSQHCIKLPQDVAAGRDGTSVPATASNQTLGSNEIQEIGVELVPVRFGQAVGCAGIRLMFGPRRPHRTRILHLTLLWRRETMTVSGCRTRNIVRPQHGELRNRHRGSSAAEPVTSIVVSDTHFAVPNPKTGDRNEGKRQILACMNGIEGSLAARPRRGAAA